MIATVLRNYPAYRIEHFYQKSFLEGGVTYNQTIFLFKSADDEKFRDYKFQAGIHGVDIDADAEGGDKPKSKQTNEETFLFKDPADYEGLSDEEKQRETDAMQQHWSGFQLKTSPKPKE